MELKTYFAQDRAGNLIPNATVTIYLTGTNTLATGLKTVTDAALSNPFTASADGKIQFKAADGIYDMVVSYGTQTGPRITIQCLDQAGQVSAAQQAANDAEAARDQTQQIIEDAGEQSTLVVLAQPTGAGKSGLLQGGTVQDAIGWVTPEMFLGKADGVTDNKNAILSALAYAYNNKRVCKFSNGTYYSSDITVDYPVAVEVSANSFLNFALIVKGKHFADKRTVATTLPWASVPAGTTNIAGDYSAFTVGGSVALKLNDATGGSASQGNEAGIDVSLISAKSASSITLGTATRFAYQNPDVIELQAATLYSGTLAEDDYLIPGDFTALFSAGDIIRIENITGTYAVEAKPYYFEHAKIHSISSAGIVLKSRLNYSHTNPWIVRAAYVPGVSITGEGRIKRVEIRQCDAPKVSGLSIDRLIVSYGYDVGVFDINAKGVSEPSTVNFSFCFGRSKAHNVRAGGSSAVTDNAAVKFMSCPKMQITDLSVDNTTATGSQGDYGVYVDALFTPYYCWNKAMAVDGVTVEKPRSPVNRAVWFYGLRDSVVTNIKGGQVFLQGSVNSHFSGIVTPNEQLEIRDLVGCNVSAFCKSASPLGNIDCDFDFKTTGLGTGGSLNIACRFGAGTRNPLTGDAYTIGLNNRIDINSLSESASAVTIQLQSQDGVIIGNKCRDKSTVASSITISGVDVTNPSMEPNKLKGTLAAGSGWVGSRMKGGINFDGNYADGYWRSNGYYIWAASNGTLRMSLTKPTSDNPSGVIIVGP